MQQALHLTNQNHHNTDFYCRKNFLCGNGNKTRYRTIAEKLVGEAKRIQELIDLEEIQEEFELDLPKVGSKPQQHIPKEQPKITEEPKEKLKKRSY